MRYPRKKGALPSKNYSAVNEWVACGFSYANTAAMTQTFFVGIGAHRSGTSWLYHFLNGNPDCRLSSMKEMHYFDSMHRQDISGILSRITRHRLRMRPIGFKQLAYWTGLKRFHGYTMREHFALLNAYETLVSTREYSPPAYAELLRQHAQDRKVFGEITPAYAILPSEQIGQIYSAFPNTKLIYLIRDPISRLWSHARRAAGNDRDRTANTILQDINSGKYPDVLKRSDYRETILALERAVPGPNVHIEFSENLFSGGETAAIARRKICDFLTIPNHSPPTVDQVRNGAPPGDLSDQLARETMAWLRPQYNFIADRFGYLPDSWASKLEAYG